MFAISYHTPSLAPGNTQYVRDERELQTFLGWLEGYLEFFFGEMRGRSRNATCDSRLGAVFGVTLKV